MSMSNAEPSQFVSLDPTWAAALSEWIQALMKEATGPALDGVFVTKDGRKAEVSFEITDVFSAIYTVCPEAIGLMLKAGAANYIREVTPWE